LNAAEASALDRARWRKEQALHSTYRQSLVRTRVSRARGFDNLVLRMRHPSKTERPAFCDGAAVAGNWERPDERDMGRAISPSLLAAKDKSTIGYFSLRLHKHQSPSQIGFHRPATGFVRF
jgi:hypothetical protein